MKTLTGKSVGLELSKYGTVADLKESLCEREGIPPDQQRLVIAGRQLNDDDLLDSADFSTEGATVHLVLRLRGGPVANEKVEEKSIPAPPSLAGYESWAAFGGNGDVEGGVDSMDFDMDNIVIDHGLHTVKAGFAGDVTMIIFILFF